MPRSSFLPSDMKCTDCGAPPGLPCRALSDPTRRLYKPHAIRTIAARRATEAVVSAKPTASVSSAWTCPACSQTFWQPRGWSNRVWQAARDAAQMEHGRQHREERDAAAMEEG